MKTDFLKIFKLKDLDPSMLQKESCYSDKIIALVEEILLEIKEKGPEPLIKYISKFDNYSPKNIGQIRVSDKEIKYAVQTVERKHKKLINALDTSIKNIKNYHQHQLKKEPKSWFIKPAKGKKLGQIVNPINRIGIYVPGGRYSYPSSLIMAAIPAIVVGVKEIVLVTPPAEGGKVNDVILFLCNKLGIEEIYKIGGAQAIALLAYGVGDIEKVDKIAGPGNIYVTLAKKKVYGDVGIDSLAGPSEIVIIADDTAEESFVAADLISQAEHDPNSRSILLSNKEFIKKVSIEIGRQLENLLEKYPENGEIALQSIKSNCMLVYGEDIFKLTDLSNKIGPEHLEIICKQQKRVLKKIKNAGAIFLGNYTPVAIGDYSGGTNHIIPTSRNARFCSPLGVYDFIKKSSVTYYGKEALKKERRVIEQLAEYEKLYGHRNSVAIRYKED